MSLILVGACIGGHRHHRQAVNSSMTLGMFDNLFDALALFAKQCGGYPSTLAALKSPEAGSARSCARLGTFADAIRAEGLHKEGDDIGMFAYSVNQLSNLRDSGVYREYRIRYVPSQQQGNGFFGAYTLSADPVEREVTGFFSYWMSERGDIHRNETAAAGPGDPLYRSASQRRPTKG